MKKFKLILTHMLLVAMIASSVSPAYVYAGELSAVETITDDGGTEDILYSEPDGADLTDEEMTIDTADPDPSDMSRASDIGTITAIEAPKKTVYSFEHKYSLIRLMENLPGTLKIFCGKKSSVIDIVWKCREDYDKELDRYTFVPDLAGYTLAEDVELPVITVTFEGERPEYLLCSSRDEKVSYDSIPFYDSGNDLGTDALPKSYNGWKSGKLPKVRNQRPYGTCWAFSAIAAMEADLIHDGKATTSIDLSELHTAYYGGNYTDPKNLRKDSITNYGPESWLDNGAWIHTGVNLMTNLTGAVNESTVPYGQALTISQKLKDKSYAVSKDKYQLVRAYYYNNGDRSGIKQAIIDHGAVMAGFSVIGDYYNSTWNSYYNPYEQNGGGHFITLVGWDDSFPARRFGTSPSGNGAWLARNSWGYDGYDLDGYFWISYYDWGLLNWSPCAIALDAAKTKYKNCYSYDGQVNWEAWYEEKTPCTVKTKYKVSAEEAVQAVGFVIWSDNVNAKVTVTNKETGKSSSGSIHCPIKGFYTVKLEKPVKVPDKASVEVAIRYTSPTGLVRVGCEWDYSGYGGAKNLYYTTKCDKGFTINGEKCDNDPRMKIYTVADKKVKVTGVKLDRDSKTIKKGKTFKLVATVKPKNATDKRVTWKSSNDKVAKVSQSGKVTAKKKGTATITVTTKDGKKKAKCKVTVKKK